MMVLRFICQHPLYEGRQIVEIPREARILRVKGRRIQFFDNKGLCKELKGRVYKIPDGAKKIRIKDYHQNRFTVYYGSEIIFYDDRLKELGRDRL